LADIIIMGQQYQEGKPRGSEFGKFPCIDFQDRESARQSLGGVRSGERGVRGEIAGVKLRIKN
jgi:hypothetical protein